jgi:hypothetical protein
MFFISPFLRTVYCVPALNTINSITSGCAAICKQNYKL